MSVWWDLDFEATGPWAQLDKLLVEIEDMKFAEDEQFDPATRNTPGSRLWANVDVKQRVGGVVVLHTSRNHGGARAFDVLAGRFPELDFVGTMVAENQEGEGFHRFLASCGEVRWDSHPVPDEVMNAEAIDPDIEGSGPDSEIWQCRDDGKLPTPQEDETQEAANTRVYQALRELGPLLPAAGTPLGDWLRQTTQYVCDWNARLDRAIALIEGMRAQGQSSREEENALFRFETSINVIHALRRAQAAAENKT